MKTFRILSGAGILISILLDPVNIQAQGLDQIVEKRAQEMHRNFIQSNEKEWELFILNNYSQKFLEKYEMSRHLEMFRRLNNDFSNSEIKSIKVKEANVFMVIERISDKHVVTFNLDYDENDSYKFNGFSIEAGEL